MKQWPNFEYFQCIGATSTRENQMYEIKNQTKRKNKLYNSFLALCLAKLHRFKRLEIIATKCVLLPLLVIAEKKKERKKSSLERHRHRARAHTQLPLFWIAFFCSFLLRWFRFSSADNRNSELTEVWAREIVTIVEFTRKRKRVRKARDFVSVYHSYCGLWLCQCVCMCLCVLVCVRIRRIKTATKVKSARQ